MPAALVFNLFGFLVLPQAQYRIPQSTSIFAEDVHVEDVAVLDTLHNADGNVDERIFVQYKQSIV